MLSIFLQCVQEHKITKSAKAVEEKGQANISTMFQRQYATSSTKHALVTKKLVKLICCNSLPMSMVDFSEFHEFVQELDPLYVYHAVKSSVHLPKKCL